MQNPISRRSALKLPAAVVAALALGAVAPEQAGAAPTDILSDPTTNAAYVAWFAAWNQRHAVDQVEALSLEEQVRAQVSPEMWASIERYVIATTDLMLIEHDRCMRLVEHHVPGLASTLRLLREHAEEVGHGAEANCCRLT